MARIAGLLGIVSALMGFAFPFVFGAMDPSYDHTRDFISELGAMGAPNAALVNGYGFLPVGLLMTGFSIVGWAVLPRSWASTIGFTGIFFFALGYIGAAFFPCDAGCSPAEPSQSQMLHNLFGLVGYLGAPVFMAILALASRRWPGGEWLSLVAAIGAAAAAAGLSGLFDESAGTAGQSQRVLEAGVLVWVLACGSYLLARTHRPPA